MKSERQKIEKLFTALCKQPMRQFPQNREKLEAPLVPGVYIIRKGDIVLHIGRTLRGKEGLRQRLKNHIYGSSSFTNEYLKGNSAALRKGHTYQFLVAKDDRLRALLEAYAIGTLCPKHIGLGGWRGPDLGQGVRERDRPIVTHSVTKVTGIRGRPAWAGPEAVPRTVADLPAAGLLQAGAASAFAGET